MKNSFDSCYDKINTGGPGVICGLRRMVLRSKTEAMQSGGFKRFNKKRNPQMEKAGRVTASGFVCLFKLN